MGRTAHLTNGDSTAGSLQATGLGGSVLAWRDVLSEGPLPATDDLRFAEVRAAYLAGTGYGDPATIRSGYAEDFRRLGDTAAADEVVLWFEHDLHDQVQLVFLLDWLARRGLRGGTLSLVSIDRYPGIASFAGLGQLSPAQLAGLYPSRQVVSPAMIALGRKAWSAFTAETPDGLNRLAVLREPALPFLPAAVRRYLEEYPALGTGLSRTEQTILAGLADGPATPPQLFARVSAREEARFMGDSSFWRILRGLARGPGPLVSLHGPADDGPELPDLEVRATGAGLDVLHGRANATPLHGLDRWHGGVHLRGPETPWAWNPATRQVVPLPRPGAGA